MPQLRQWPRWISAEEVVDWQRAAARLDSRRSVPEFDKYVEAIEERIDSLEAERRKAILIFVASDESIFIYFIAKRFCNVAFFKTARYDERTQEREARGKMGWRVLSFIRHDR